VKVLPYISIKASRRRTSRPWIEFVARQGGEVRIVKEVVTERKHLDVPVTREQVRVERVAASGAAANAPARSRFERETVRVPITEEEVNVTSGQ